MASAAAIFDLDRTLLAGASGPVISAALREAGVISSRTIPGEGLLYGLFNRVGETLPSMALARQAANVARGWRQALVDEAAKSAAELLLDRVQPRARAIIDEHRREGRLLVLATTTPYDLVKPLADLLGFDDVVATRYGVADDGTYNGTIVGNFVWANGKLAAVRKWADERGVDLASSYFYSDSVYDTPLLSAVGHPVAVNPDPRLRLVASARRWPTLHLDVPDGVPKFLGFEPQQVAMAFTRPELVLYARFDIAGVERIPNRGPAIIVANHRSYFDITAMAMLFSKVGRPVRFLGKKEVFDVPVVGQVARAFGGIRVDRGTGSDEPLKAAVAALDAGDLVAIMPQGTIPRGPAFFEPELKGRWGAARLAKLTGAPVIPVGLWGTEKVWPRSARVPNMLNVADPPHVSAVVGAAVELEHTGLAADTRRIMTAISQLLPPESQIRQVPTPEELAATYPPGYKGDPDGETDRRPGSD